MEIEAAEKWIVDLIRGSKLDAKIDSRDNNVIMGGTFPSVYQQVGFRFVMFCLVKFSSMLLSQLTTVALRSGFPLGISGLFSYGGDGHRYAVSSLKRLDPFRYFHHQLLRNRLLLISFPPV